MTMEADGDLNIPQGVQTAAAMVVALATYTMVYYVAVSLVLIAEDSFPGLFAFALMGTRPNVVLMIAAVFGAVASMLSAKTLCDLTLSPYRTRPLFLMFAGVLGAMTLGKIWAPSTGLQMTVVAQYLAAMATAWVLFWREGAVDAENPSLPPEN